ncbi:hypothetical protein M9H61_08425 [Thalassospira sp. GO-4]|jgi:hypothetical protein|uniref:ABC-three component system protein n=1 Tax=Thalassospira sp. GO-4 TaxID=2946605 RepID=UPI002023DB1F|nr:ABC-three component system protein [Thalassospira sp. GO-4]URK19516.1 hypothetical protein M9H61_08425 [Thalassospira sp. GO-4]
MNQITTLLECLSKEISADEKEAIKEFASDLYLYVHQRDEEDPDTLDTKLESANRQEELSHANRTLERFTMLLEKYQHFPSGQKLLAFFLSHIHDVFTFQIKGKNLSDSEIDDVIRTQIVEKIIADMGNGSVHFTINANHVRGMVYFLADRCYVRWDDKCSA